jgi:hypothetical protein
LFVQKRNAAITAPELLPDDGIVDSYTAAIDSIGLFHDALNDLRWAIMVHDGLGSPSASKPTANVGELFAELGL